MASIRNVRRALPFDPAFVARHPLLWPLAAAARPFAEATTWPSVASWGAIFCASVTPPVRFAVAAPRPRRGRRRPFDLAAQYDASISERGVVPSRERHWHDFLNALVWGTFPRAKAALHRRQRALIAARVDPAAARLPAHRTREQDGLAMIDEGGVLALAAPDGERYLVFGHAVYEGFVLGVRGMTARLVQLPVAALAPAPLAQADAALAEWLAAPSLSTRPEDLPRIAVPDAAVVPWI